SMLMINGMNLKKIIANSLTFRVLFALVTGVLSIVFLFELIHQFYTDTTNYHDSLIYCWDLGISAVFMALLSITAITKAII
ncbi:MAG: hypothetical protein ACRCZ4_08460, partial [Plesiomonas sp.]|uniref:hypothetical protein n=1 Tax=Plesiomonas sp. TaxID=2486279 RepID=UPI003F2CC272